MEAIKSTHTWPPIRCWGHAVVPENYCSSEFLLLSFRQHSLSGPKALRLLTVKGKTWWICSGKPSRGETYDMVLRLMPDLAPPPKPLWTTVLVQPCDSDLSHTHPTPTLGRYAPSKSIWLAHSTYSRAASFAGVWPGHSFSCEWHSGDHDDLWLWRP